MGIRRRVREATTRVAFRHANGAVGRIAAVSGLVHLPPEGARRVEVGSGRQPRPGYLHVDIDPALPWLHVVAPAHRLPFPTGWCDEILAVHMLEHVPAGALGSVVAEWHRCLRPGGVVAVHTPNGTTLGRLLASSDAANMAQLWAVQSAIFGYDRHPDAVTDAASLGVEPDHKVLFTPELLASTLTQAGFAEVTDVTGADALCHHTEDWAHVVPGMCLEMRAVKPSGASRPPSSRPDAAAP